MTYTPVRSGFTGPSAKIGGSSDYHIDLKLLKSLPIAEQVKALDVLASQYRRIGREIEFSNPSVAGARWSSEADLADKVDLLNRATAAHGHSQHPDWLSVDFYAPFKGKSRFEKGAVEGASIFIPGVPGGKVTRGEGGGYGYFSEASDPSGKVLFRVGHGDIGRPEEETVVAVSPTGSTPAGQPDLDAGVSDKADRLLETVLGTLLADYAKGRKAPEIPTEKEEKEKGITRDELKEILALKKEEESRKEAETAEAKRFGQFVSALEATKARMAQASAQAMQAFKSPASLV